MFCKKCGNEVQDDWVACPKCGEPLLQQSSKNKMKNNNIPNPASLAKTVFAVIFVVIFLATCSGPSSPKRIDTSPQKSAKKQVLVLAEADARHIAIINANDFDWVSPSITIWDGLSGYNLQVDTIKAKDKRLYLLSDFTNGNKRFDGRSIKPEKITIVTDTAAGGMNLQ